MHNSNTLTMGENISYFTYKYSILYDDWFNNLNNIYIKINAHIHSISIGVLRGGGKGALAPPPLKLVKV